MNWITGLQRAMEYLEENLTQELEISEIAKRACCSEFHFQRIFSILCGIPLGEYIKNRRLSLAGEEWMTGTVKVIDLALKYGYDSPDSFTRAFTRFHGVTPSAARQQKIALKAFSRLSVKLSLEGGNMLDYRIEHKDPIAFTGYRQHFEGVPGQRYEKERDFFTHTRVNQYLLRGISFDWPTQYTVVTDQNENGFDFWIASVLREQERRQMASDISLGKEAERFETFTVPAHDYVVCRTEHSRYPTLHHMELRQRMVCEWLPSSGYLLSDAPEIAVTHWFAAPDNDNRYIELWLPIEPNTAARA